MTGIDLLSPKIAFVPVPNKAPVITQANKTKQRRDRQDEHGSGIMLDK